MKMLTIVMVLMFTPFVSHAEWNNHFKHNNHERKHNNSFFWQDVERRQYRQESRIDKGIEKGQLTRREVRKLHKEQKHVAKQIRHIRRDNRLSRGDRREVMEHLDYVSDKIRSLKHNQRYAHRKNHNKKVNQGYSNNRNSYRNDRYLSWANNASSAGIYFRF